MWPQAGWDVVFDVLTIQFLKTLHQIWGECSRAVSFRLDTADILGTGTVMADLKQVEMLSCDSYLLS